MTDAKNEHPEPVVIARFAKEFEAVFARARLEENGIHSEIAGQHTAGLRAEAPAYVEVLVPGTDAERARAILEELANESAPEGAEGESE